MSFLLFLFFKCLKFYVCLIFPQLTPPPPFPPWSRLPLPPAPVSVAIGHANTHAHKSSGCSLTPRAHVCLHYPHLMVEHREPAAALPGAEETLRRRRARTGG